jgi:hypothetical protein
MDIYLFICPLTEPLRECVHEGVLALAQGARLEIQHVANSHARKGGLVAAILIELGTP